MSQSTPPKKLPWCNYPKSADVQQHGLFKLQERLPNVDFASAQKYRSSQYNIMPLMECDNAQVIAVAKVIANSFAINEPMNRHVAPPKKMPEALERLKHRDALGHDCFGDWTSQNLLFWFVRLIITTKPTDPSGAIGTNEDVFRHSFLITNNDSKPIAASLNTTLASSQEQWRENDPFIEGTFLYQAPIIDLLYHHEKIAIQALDDNYPHFKKAHQSGKVGYIAMIARSPELDSEYTFELFASSFEHFQREGYEYMLITGTNQWTGAACEALGAARVYFAPFRDNERVAKTIDAKPNEPFSSDGYISAKDSGLMIYAVKL